MSQTIALISSAIDSNDEYYLAKLFDIKFINESKESFKQIAQNPRMISNLISTKYWIDIVKNIANISQCDDGISPDDCIHRAFQYYCIASTTFFKNQKDNKILCAVYKSISQSCFYFSANSKKCYSDSKSLLDKIFSLAINPAFRAQVRTNDPILTISNYSVKILLLQNNYNLSQRTFGLLSKVDMNSFNNGELATYYFLRGKVNMVYGHRHSAYADFKKSLEYIPLFCKKDRRLVYVHFIPVCLSFGIVPTEELLNSYNLFDVYSDFSEAVSTGNLELFNQALNRKQLFLIHFGVWEMIAYSRRIIIRRILEMIKIHTGITIIYIDACKLALSLSGEEFSFDDAVLEIANLINDKLIMANIAYQRNLVVFRPSDTFKLPNPEENSDDDD